MCGIAGEIRLDGGIPDVAAVARITEAMHRRGPDGTGVHAAGPDRARPPPSQDHRPLRARRPAHGRRRAGPGRRVQRLHLQLPRAARRAGGGGLPLLLHLRHGGAAQGVPPLGRARAWSASSACSRSPSPSATPACSPSAATGWASSRSTSPRPPSGIRFASALPALLDGGGVDTSIDPVALHHYMTFHSVVPAPRTILAGVRKLPPATVRTIRPDGTGEEHVYWRPEHVRRAQHEGMSARDWRDAVLESLRVAVRRRMVADVPVGVLLSGGLDSSLVVALLADEGQVGLKTFSVGLPRHGGRERRRVRVLRPHRQALRHRPPADPRRPRPDAARRRRRHHRDERADGQPRLRGLLPALRGGREVGQGRAVRAGRRRGVRGLQLVPAAGRGAPLARRARVRARVHRPSPRRPGGHPRTRVAARRRPEPRVRRRALRPRGRRPRRSTQRCGSTRRSCWWTTRSSGSTT